MSSGFKDDEQPVMTMLGYNPFLMAGLPFTKPKADAKVSGYLKGLLKQAVIAMTWSDMAQAGKLISQVERKLGVTVGMMIEAGAIPRRPSICDDLPSISAADNRKTNKGPKPQEGERYDSGDLKPPKPNPRVVELRRAILGAEDGDECDIRQAENPLDVAVARGWMTVAQRQAAHAYSKLIRRVFSKMPLLKVSKQMADVKVHSQLRAEERVLSKTGVQTKADHDLKAAIRDFESNRITALELRRAERAHRVARIDLRGMPYEDIAALFNAIMESTTYSPPVSHIRSSKLLDIAVGADHDRSTDDETNVARQRMAEDLELLQQIWSSLAPEEARELISMCVLAEWPQWMTLTIFGRFVPQYEYAKQSCLLSGLDRVISILTPVEPAPPPSPRRKNRKLMHEEITRFVDGEGNLVREHRRLIYRS